MTCTTIAVLSAMGGAAFGYSISAILWAGRRADDQFRPHAIEELEITIGAAADGLRVWVNAETGCVGRWYRIKRLHLDDRR
jgi:hypothetical protein